MQINYEELSQNWKQCPLKQDEIPPKTDIEYLYLTCNLSTKELIKFFNVTRYRFVKWLKLYNIIKTQELLVEKRKQTCIKKYGVDNPSKNNKIKEKIKDVQFKKHGCWASQTAEVREKVNNTNMQKYGAKCNFQIDYEKRKQTWLKKYGVDNPSKNKEIRQKQKNTLKERYGAEHPAQCPEIRRRQLETTESRYGVKYPTQNPETIKKRDITMLERYGCVSVSQIPEGLAKIRKTFVENKRKNGKMSKIEKKCYEKLLVKFNKNDIIYEYVDEQRYPFKCDFYIKSIDLFIEIQGYQGHGKEPFDPENETHLKLIEFWKNKSREVNFKGNYKNQYLGYIHTWTVSDPEKRLVAKQNKLNWVEFFNERELNSWLENFYN